MYAVRWHGRGDVRYEEVLSPSIVDPGSVLLSVEACGVCGTDFEEAQNGPKAIPVAAAHPLTGRQAPIILGHETIGRVIAAGVASSVAIGDRVVVWPLVPCRQCATCVAGEGHRCPKLGVLGLSSDGGFAEYLKADSASCIRIGDGIPIERAVLVEPYAVALHAFAHAAVEGRKVLIIGMGSIGLALVEIARELGSSRIVVVSRDPRNRELGLAAGADAALPPEKVDGVAADVAVDSSGGPDAMKLLARGLAYGGHGVLVGVRHQYVEAPLWDIFSRELTLVGSNGMRFDEEFRRAVQLVETGRLGNPPRPVAFVELRALPQLLVGRTHRRIGRKHVAVRGEMR